MSFQNIMIFGRLGKDPEVKQINTVKGSTTVAKFSIAVQEKEKNEYVTEWFNIVCFGKTADMLGGSLKKGSNIVVMGKQKTNTWEDKAGKRQYRQEIVVDKFSFVDKKTGGVDGMEPESSDFGATPANSAQEPNAGRGAAATNLPSSNNNQSVLEDLPF